MKSLIAILLVVASLSFAGCRSHGTPDAGVTKADRGLTASSASFRRDIAPVLEKSCAAEKGCHGPEPTDSVSLELRAAAAYGELVDRAAEARPGAMRVVPGDPEHSFLLAKLLGELRAGEGKAMPLDPETGAPLPLTPEMEQFVERVLKPWIAAGAPNN